MAETTVEVHVVDAPSAAQFSLLLDRTPFEVIAGPFHDAEVKLFMRLRDLLQFWTGDLHVAIAITEGRIGYQGPVRKVLRVLPLVRHYVPLFIEQYGPPAASGRVSDRRGPALDGAKLAGDQRDEPGVSVADARLLDDAAEYQRELGELHEGAREFEERYAGEFWSIRCDRITKSFGPNKVLHDLDFFIPEGMITVVLGPSGTGKSVLINQLIGLSFPDRGEVVVHGESLSRMTRARLADVRKEFGILFQDGALFGSLSVYDNVAFPLRQHTDLDEGEIEQKVVPRLADVGLAEHLDKMPNELSGGMRKRAGFARALMLDPSVVLFDEPDSGLDPVRTALLCELISQTHRQFGGTFVLITHDIASARQVGEFIAVLWKGKIVQAGEARRMFESENPFVRQFLNRDIDGPLGME
jgi:phospholipid/cholesterol/gamma-HCH transport system ATP-binding protein